MNDWATWTLKRCRSVLQSWCVWSSRWDFGQSIELLSYEMEINGVTTINEALAADHDLFVEYNSNKHQYGTNNEYQLSLSFLIFILLLLTCFFMSHFIHHKLKIQALPEAGVSICIGMIAGFIALLQSESPQSESPLSESSSLLVGFNPTIFFVALLPPIIFQSGTRYILTYTATLGIIHDHLHT